MVAGLSITTYTIRMGVKYSVNESFFNHWTPVMAYILGYWYADGSMYISARGKYIVVTSIDESTVLKIKNWLSSQHTVRVDKSTWPNGKLRFALRIGNAKLYDSLIHLGLHPNKSLTARMPKVPVKFLKDFIRGYFDGDGCVNLYRSKGISQKVILRKLSVIFTSGSKKFLEGLLLELRRVLELRQTKIYNSQRSFQLRFATKDSVTLFGFMYNNIHTDTLLHRKYQIFTNYFELRPQRIDKRVNSVLQCLNNGHVVK